jgi:signal transduction histidine kinase
MTRTRNPIPAAECRDHRMPEDALRLERDRLEDILDRMEEGVHIVSGQHKILYANRALLEEFGALDERRCHEYFYGRPDPCPWCETNDVLSGKTVHTERYSAKTGRTYDLFGTPIQDEHGVIHKLEIHRDITQQRKLEEDLKEADKQSRQLSMRLLQVHEMERRRRSRELHDDLGQSLSILKLRIGFLRRQLGQEQDSLKNECSDMLDYLNQVIESTRRLSHELSPSILDDLGLGTALRRLVTQFTKICQWNVVSRIEDIGRLSSRDAEINLYRVVQEALTNIERHARAQNVSVVVERREREIFCLIEDDGSGFDPKQASADPARSGMGLAVMRERTGMLGAAMDLQSQVGKGTRISFSFSPEQAGSDDGSLSHSSGR